MATGIELMLKSLGLDPAEIKKQVAEFGQLVVSFNAKLDDLIRRVEMLQQRIDGATVIKQTENGECRTEPLLTHPARALEAQQPLDQQPLDQHQQPANL